MSINGCFRAEIRSKSQQATIIWPGTSNMAINVRSRDTPVRQTKSHDLNEINTFEISSSLQISFSMSSKTIPW